MAILIENCQKKTRLDLRRIRQSLNRIVRYLECGNKEVSLRLVDNGIIREINRQYLGRDYATNVMSFSLSEGEFGNINPSVLGDIIISVEKALSDARKARMNFYDEVDFLMIHGLLHLTGYNHEDNADAEETSRMEKKERQVFFKLNGYWASRHAST